MQVRKQQLELDIPLEKEMETPPVFLPGESHGQRSRDQGPGLESHMEMGANLVVDRQSTGLGVRGHHFLTTWTSPR